MFTKKIQEIEVVREDPPAITNTSVMGGPKNKTNIEPIVLDIRLINGYDGFGGVHDNLLYNPALGLTMYTLNNKCIIEWTDTKTKKIYSEPMNKA